MTILVLGVGGNVSQGILKALSQGGLRCRLIGACVTPLAAGLYATDRAYVSPLADDPGFLDWLADLCERERVDAVLSGVEPVLARLSESEGWLRERTGAVALVSPPDRLAIGADKLTTARWLAQHDFNAPRSADADDDADVERLVADCGYPVIAKPRAGKSAKGVFLVEGQADLEYFRHREGYVIQEHLGDEGSEYTVGCVSDREGIVRGTMAMRRELLDGTTVRARAGDFPDLRGEATRIAAALRPTGPLNVQMRIHEGRPVCFELNVRFSGTTPMRARLGFDEVEAALRHFVLGEEMRDLPLVTEGVALRYWNELYVDPAAVDALERQGQLEDPRTHPLRFEDWGLRP